MKVAKAKHKVRESDVAPMRVTSTDGSVPANAMDGIAADMTFGFATSTEDQADQTASSGRTASTSQVGTLSTPVNAAEPESPSGGSACRVKGPLNFDLLLQESWASYLAAKETGTPAQRVTALKAVYEHLSHHERLQDSGGAHPFSSLSDDALLTEVKRLMTLLSPTLGLTADWHA